MTSIRKPPSPTATLLLVGLLCLIWGSTWLVIKTGLKDLPPLTSASVRFAIAFVVLAIVAPALSRREGGDPPPRWLWLTSGVLNFGMSYGIVYVSETLLPSGLVSVIWAVFPLMIAGAGHFVLPDERLSTRQLAGFVIGFLGIVFLFFTDVKNVGANAIPMALFLLLSPLVSTVGNTLVKKHGAASSSVLLNRNAMGIGALVLGACAATFESNSDAQWTTQAWFSVVYLAIVGTVVTFSLYFWLLRFARANRLALIAFVTPCVALLLGWSVGGETIDATTLGGSALVLAGVALVVLGRRVNAD